MPVIYNLGNECSRCKPSEEWERGLYDAIKAALAEHGVDRPVGNTVKLSNVRVSLDYRTYHGFGPVPADWPRDIPTMLTESDNESHSPAEWAALARTTEARGGYLAVWRGPDSWDTHNGAINAMPKLGEPGPEPEPPPPPDCATLGTPTAREAKAQGKDPTINVQRTVAGPLEIEDEIRASKWISGTPVATFGKDYYCAIGWAEACNEGETRGPVASEGVPTRLAREACFLEAPCPMFSMDHCTGTGGQCPITWDPYIVIDGVNQNHPENVRAGCRESTWIRDPGDGIVRGEWWKASAHGKGYLKACNFDGSVCGTSTFEIDQ
jgi:hypothetical protein